MADASACRSCGAGILWVETTTGKRMPLDADSEQQRVVLGDDGKARVSRTWLSHFATCPDAARHRQPR